MSQFISENIIEKETLEFCSCGKPELAYKQLQMALRQVQNFRDFVCTNQQSWGDWEKETHQFLGNETATSFMWYFLNKEGYTEHCHQLPGWLTPKGIQILESLEKNLSL